MEYLILKWNLLSKDLNQIVAIFVQEFACCFAIQWVSVSIFNAKYISLGLQMNVLDLLNTAAVFSNIFVDVM